MKRILYVEDNQDTAEATRIMLSGAGYEVDIAFSGKEGLKKLADKEFDLILLDIMLPDMSGWDIFEKIRTRDSGKECKYAFLSAIPVSPERMNELKKQGASDYITKPFTKDELLSRVKRLIG